MAGYTYTVKALHLPCGAVEYSSSQIQVGGDTPSGIPADQYGTMTTGYILIT
jgi:hypothetical protein